MSRLPESVCVVAIARHEQPFIDEWIIYHRLIGVDHFYLYDNDSKTPLKRQLARYRRFVTVIDWPGDPTAGLPGRNRQTRTYEHARAEYCVGHDWVAFIDIDEFIVLRRHANLPEFLRRFGGYGSVRLTWHVFGHNGHYDNPEGLVTASLTRRMSKPGRQTKSITRPRAILRIDTAHLCRLKPGYLTADGNRRIYTDRPYEGMTAVAHVNHYHCRSFVNWMSRANRGDVAFGPTEVPAEHRWRLDENLLLRQFVETVALDKNEVVDEFMVRFEPGIRQFMPAKVGEANGREIDIDPLTTVISGSETAAGQPAAEGAGLARWWAHLVAAIHPARMRGVLAAWFGPRP